MMNVCFICGETESATRELVPIVNTPVSGDQEILWICRHGHWDMVVIHAFTGAPVYLTGPRADATTTGVNS